MNYYKKFRIKLNFGKKLKSIFIIIYLFKVNIMDYVNEISNSNNESNKTIFQILKELQILINKESSIHSLCINK